MNLPSLLLPVFLLLASPAFATGDFDPELEARVRQLTEELRCLVCQNQSIADSNAPLAVDLRREVRQMLESGADRDQVRDFMVARYGDFVLYDPPLHPATWLLWGGPLLFAALGLWLLLRALRAQFAAARMEETP